VQTFRGRETAPPGSRLRINAHGPVTLTSDASGALSYSVEVATKVRSEQDARRLLSGFGVRVARQGGWITLNAPRGPALVRITVAAPRGLKEAVVSTSDGEVEVVSIDAPLRIDSGAGGLKVERAGADCRLMTNGGPITVGAVEGTLTAITLGGPITVRSARGEALLETAGGDIVVDNVGGMLRANTAAGTIRVANAGATAVLTTAGGSIVVNRARGVVTARNAAGPVRVGAASGLHCDTGTGAVNVANVTGDVRVSTAAGNIIANFLAGRIGESFLTTGNGDITVLLPSNLGVTVRAENEMADTLQRIISEFPGLPVRLRGSQIVAEGPINGGGPLLLISGAGGTIFIKRQQ
jgi:hypothetical protein